MAQEGHKWAEAEAAAEGRWAWEEAGEADRWAWGEEDKTAWAEGK